MRKKAKEYGTCKLAEGPDVAGRRVTLVEDVITTGGAVRDATRALRARAPWSRSSCARSTAAPSGENPLADVGLEVRPVLTKAELDAARWPESAHAQPLDRLDAPASAMSRSGRPSWSRSPARAADVRRCRHHS